MPRRALSVIAGILALTAVASLEAQAQIIEISPEARTALGIAVEPATPGEAFAGVDASAVVIAAPGSLQAAVSPFDGVIIEPLVMPGMEVEAGDPVAVVYSKAFAEAQAEFETLQMTAEHMAELAERAQGLLQSGLISRTDAEEAHHDARSAQLDLHAMEQRFDLIAAQERPGSKFVVKAPITGVIAHLHTESGDSVTAEGPIASVFAGQAFWARALAPERLADLLTIGSHVRVAGWSEYGELVAIDPEVDSRTRSIEVLAHLPDGGPWRLGQIVDLSFMAEAPASSVSVPAEAIVRIGEDDIVFIERAGGFDLVRVEILARSRERILIAGELRSGDRVVVSGLAALKNIAESRVG